MVDNDNSGKIISEVFYTSIEFKRKRASIRWEKLRKIILTTRTFKRIYEKGEKKRLEEIK
jgi:hypothetical protein